MNRRWAWGAAIAVVFGLSAAGIWLAGMRRVSDVPETRHSQAVTDTFETYVNARFAYSVCYPRELLFPQGEAVNGDGQRFVSKDGLARVVVFGSNNVLEQTLQQIFDQDSKDFDGRPVSVSDRSIGGDSFTFSGDSGGDIVFEKTYLRNDRTKTLDIVYPKTAGAAYAALVRRMAECFRSAD